MARIVLDTDVASPLGTRAWTELVSWLGRRIVLPYDERVAWRWGQLSAQSERRGRTRPTNDTWIAACCPGRWPATRNAVSID